MAVSGRLAQRPGGIESLIVLQFPSFFEKFLAKQLVLLWQSSRNDFNITEFHYPCDCGVNNLTLILAIDRNIRGHLTLVE
jgi:hypothetical protein